MREMQVFFKIHKLPIVHVSENISAVLIKIEKF